MDVEALLDWLEETKIAMTNYGRIVTIDCIIDQVKRMREGDKNYVAECMPSMPPTGDTKGPAGHQG